MSKVKQRSYDKSVSISNPSPLERALTENRDAPLLTPKHHLVVPLPIRRDKYHCKPQSDTRRKNVSTRVPSASQATYTSSKSSTTSLGLPPLSFESHRILRLGSIPSSIIFHITGPNDMRRSLPIQIRNQPGFCKHVESPAPMPVPVQIRTPRR